MPVGENICVLQLTVCEEAKIGLLNLRNGSRILKNGSNFCNNSLESTCHVYQVNISYQIDRGPMQIRALRALSDLSSETVNIPVMHTLTASSKEFLRKSWYVCTPPSVKNKTCKIKSQEAYLRVPEKRETSHTHFF